MSARGCDLTNRSHYHVGADVRPTMFQLCFIYSERYIMVYNCTFDFPSFNQTSLLVTNDG